MSRPHATMHSDAQAGERRTSGRHSRAVARRARGTSHSGMVGTATGTSTGAAVRMRDIPPVGSTRFARLRWAVPTEGLYASDFVFWALRCERHRRALPHEPVSRSARSNQPEARRSKRSPRLKRGGVLPSAQKTMAANFVRCLRDRGESVKGGLPPPFHIPERGESRAQTPERERLGSGLPEAQALLTRQSTMTNRNSPPRTAGAQGSFDCRRETPGGPRTGPQLQAGLRPKAIPDQGPVREPLELAACGGTRVSAEPGEAPG